MLPVAPVCWVTGVGIQVSFCLPHPRLPALLPANPLRHLVTCLISFLRLDVLCGYTGNSTRNQQQQHIRNPICSVGTWVKTLINQPEEYITNLIYIFIQCTPILLRVENEKTLNPQCFKL